MKIEDEIMKNPWKAAYLITRRDLEGLRSFLIKLIKAPFGSKEFVTAADLVRALKSLGKTGLVREALKEILSRDEMREIKGKLSTNVVVSAIKTDHGLAMSIITLIEEILPYLGKDEAFDYLKALISEAVKNLGKDELREFGRALMYGPLSSLPVDLLESFMSHIASIDGGPEINILKAEFLVAVLRQYPPAVFEKNPELFNRVAEIIKAESKEAVYLMPNELTHAERIYREITNALSALNEVCRELGSWEPCKEVVSKADPDLREMYSSLGRKLARMSKELEMLGD